MGHSPILQIIFECCNKKLKTKPILGKISKYKTCWIQLDRMQKKKKKKKKEKNFGN
jgi:hypothetical protein